MFMNLFPSKADAKKCVPWLQRSDDIPTAQVTICIKIFQQVTINLKTCKITYSLFKQLGDTKDLQIHHFFPRILCFEALVAPCLDR